ncbi:MAG: histidine kinase [Eubacteriales bacterium]|nr:histidine kinase [Eubacteriales bacterium]
MRIKKFKTRLLLSMVVLSFLPILLVGLTSSILSERMIRKNYMQSQMTSLNMTDTAIETKVRGIVRSCRNILANETIMGSQEADAGYTLENRNLLEKEMQNIFFDNPDIESVFLLHNCEEIYIYSRKEKMSGVGQRFDFEEMQNQEWYQRAQAANGGEVFIGYDVINTQNTQSLSCVKLLRNLELDRQDEIEGVLIVNVEKNNMFRSLLEDEKTQSSYLIYEEAGETPVVVFEVTKEESDFSDLVIQEKSNASTGWRIVSRIGRQQLFGESENLRNSILGVAAGTGILMAVIFAILSNSLYRPLKHLEQTIIEATPEVAGGISAELMGNLEGRTYAKDEFGEIERRFWEMQVKNQELNERILEQQIAQKNSELRDLQAKINPHFLYNILDCIYWMIGMQKNEQAAKMVISLSRIMRNSLNQGKEVTTLKKEFTLLEDYLMLQSMRYEQRFTYEVSLEPELAEVPVLNLLLQPLLENSVMHGLEPKTSGGYVHVSGRYKAPWIEIRIVDNGVGMSKEQMDNPGYGIRNVRKRMELFYGEDGELKICSKEQVGTTVCVRIRWTGKEGEEHV